MFIELVKTVMVTTADGKTFEAREGRRVNYAAHPEADGTWVHWFEYMDMASKTTVRHTEVLPAGQRPEWL